MRSPTATLIFSFLTLLSSTVAQTAVATAAAASASPDGVIVPFKSGLPVCASKCGPLFDVQGKCSPPATTAVDQSCFCGDSRLTVFNNDNGVSLVCGAQSCTAAADLAAVKNWYDGYCKKTTVVTTTQSNGAVATQTNSSSSKPKTTGASSPTWMSTHYKWVIMIVIIFFAIVGGWIGACLLRRRYLRKKEREIEMKPPVAWGPHQMQGATGGYNYGDGIVDGSRGGPSNTGGYAKEYAAAVVTPPDSRQSKRESRGLHKKSRLG